MAHQSNDIRKFLDVPGTASALLGVNESNMSATAIITTPGWDRQNDSLNPEGGSTEKYKANPVVLWDHGLQISIPIAKCEHPDGSLAITKSKDGWIGTSYFSNRDRQSEQIFNLIADGIIRATSVRFMPLEQPVRKSRGNRYERWELEEWSWCPIGVNPEAVTEVLAKGRLAGSEIDGAIRKSLTACVPKPKTKAFRVGWDSMQDFTIKPLGAQLIEASHSQMKALNDNMEYGMKGLENPTVRELLLKAQEALAEVMAAMEGGYEEQYGEDMPDYEAPVEDEAEMYKSFLSGSVLHRGSVNGYGMQIQEIAERVGGRDAAALESIGKSLMNMAAEARAEATSGKAGSSEGKVDEALASAIKAAHADLAQLKSALSEFSPQNRS